MKKQIIKASQVSMNFQLQAAGSNAKPNTFEFTVPAGAQVPVTYYHEHFEESVYGLERIISFTVEGKAVDIAPGETCFIPRNAVAGVNKIKQINIK